jgi:hypothetical protein
MCSVGIGWNRANSLFQTRGFCKRVFMACSHDFATPSSLSISSFYTGASIGAFLFDRLGQMITEMVSGTRREQPWSSKR